jgi:hypothetical protein
MTTIETTSRSATSPRRFSTWSGCRVYGRDGFIGIVENSVRRGDRTALSVRSGLFIQRRDFIQCERFAGVLHTRRLLLRDEPGAGDP